MPKGTTSRERKSPSFYVAEPAKIRTATSPVTNVRGKSERTTPYGDLLKEAIIGLKSRVGSSFVAIEKYVRSKEPVGFQRHYLQAALLRALKNEKIKRHHQHLNSFVLSVKEKTKKVVAPVKSTSGRVVTKTTGKAKKLGAKPAKKTSATKPTKTAPKVAISKKATASKKKTTKKVVASKKKSTTSATASASDPTPLPDAPDAPPTTVAPTSTSSSASPLPAPAAISGVDPESGLVGKGHILVEGTDVFNIDLALQDTTTNANKFYRLQVVESNDRSKYWCVQHWGRIGTKGQCKVDSSADKAKAIAILKSKYRDKAGIDFDARNSASAVRGKYSAVELKAAAAGGRLADSNTVTFCLAWSEQCDLDIHVTAPGGQECYYGNKELRNGAGAVFCALDVDRMAHDYPNQVENIFIDTSLAPKGDYIFKVVLFSNSSAKKSIPYNSTFNNRGDYTDKAGAITQTTSNVEVVRFTL